MIRRSLRIVVLSLLFAASCASGDDSEQASNPNYVAVEAQEQSTTADTAPDPGTTDADTSAENAGSAGAVPDTAPAGELDTIIQRFDDFLSLRSQAITGVVALDELVTVATPQAVAQVEQLRTKNDELIASDSYAALSNLVEWSNITLVNQLDDGYAFTDCTERQFVTPGGATVVRFVTNRVTMVDSNGDLLVDEIIELQDGSFALTPDEFGCVPPSFIERAEQTADLAVTEAARLIADPTGALNNELPAIFRDDARDDLELALQSLSNEGLARESDETVELQVVGMDVNRAEFTVVVSVCRTYPQGRVYTSKSGEALTTDLPLGSSYEEWIYVQLDPVPSETESSGTVTAVVDRGPNCQRG